jgi:DNA-binding CsgD family transcriptional regulator
MLRQFGYGDDVEAVYLALVDNPTLTEGELAEASGLQPAAALDTLPSAGLIERFPETPPRYSAVDPELGLVGLIAAQQRMLSQAEATTRHLTERFRVARRGRDPLDVIEVVIGRDQQFLRFVQLQQLASTEIRGLDKPPYIFPGSVNEVLNERLADGISVRGIYDRAGIEIPGRTAEIRSYREAGEQQRVLDGVPFKMFIADDKLALIRLTTETATSSSLYVHPSALLDGLGLLFETLWRFAVPLHVDDAEHAAGDRPTAEQANLLGLLAAGLTDEAIARHLGVSLRTVQRQLQPMMEALGARNRFQTALQATRRGWL